MDQHPNVAEFTTPGREDHTSTKHKTIEDTVEKPTGIRVSTHGIAYQLKLLMLFMFRARKLGYTFSLGTEVTEAEKFDDVVFACLKPGDTGKEYRFLQAKHRQDDSKTIKADDLIKPTEDDFSVLKYFVSYRKIKQNEKFDGELKDFIVCTNIDLDTKVLKSVEELDRREDIFSHDISYNSKQYKLKNGSELYNLLEVMFKENHRNKLAVSLAKIVYNSKIEPDILIKTYGGWLLDNVLKLEIVDNKRCITFQDKFLHENCEGDVFLENFKTAIINSYLAINKSKTPCDIDNILKSMAIVVPRSFSVSTKDSLSLDVSDEDVKGFFDKLVLAVNQPNEKSLGNIITTEMSEYMNLIEGKFVANSVMGNVLDWVNEKLGRFLHTQDIEDMFQSCKQNVARLGLIGLSLAHKLKYKTCYRFKDNDKVIERVIKFLEENNQQQTLIVYYKTHLLNVVKILQASTNRRADEYIFCDMKLLQQLVGTVVCPIEAFRSEAYNYLVIDLQPKTMLSDEKETLKAFFEILENRSTKRMVLMVPHDQQGVAENVVHKLIGDKFIKLDDNADSFEDLTTESQQELSKSTVIYQGKRVTLESVIAKNTNTINGDVLSKLVFKETVSLDTNNDESIEVNSVILKSEEQELTDLIIKLTSSRDLKDNRALFKTSVEAMLGELILEDRVRSLHIKLPSKARVKKLTKQVIEVLHSAEKAVSKAVKDTGDAVADAAKCTEAKMKELTSKEELRKIGKKIRKFRL